MGKRRRDRKSLASAAPSASVDGGREARRFSARRKTDAILRVLRGESLDSLARELGVTAADAGALARALPRRQPGGAEESPGRRAG
jgi:hypothetical protein